MRALVVVRAPVLGPQLHGRGGRCRRRPDSRPAEIDDVLAVDDRPDQLVEIGVAAVGALGRRGEAEPERRDRTRAPPARRRGRAGGDTRRTPPARTGRRGAPCAGAPSRTSRRSAAARRTRRRRRRRRRRRTSSAARRTTGAPDPASARDERAAPPILDGQAGDPGLAGARREHDDAAALVRPPGGQRLGLVGPRLAPDARALGQLAVAAGAILDGSTPSPSARRTAA